MQDLIETSVETATAVELAGVSKRYGDVLALDRADLTVRRGERVALLGPSGCGKSTLLALIAGLEEPDGGALAVGGATDARERLAQCALMPQRDLLLPWRSALDNACLALENQGLSRAEARRRAQPLFAELGLAEFERARPSELSGGMRQRVAFLRTLLAGKDVLLLDEPFGALDSLTRAALQGWLRDALDRERRTVLLVTHDVEEALLLADRVAVLSPRPGRVLAEVAVDLPPGTRRELVVSAPFLELREQILEALE
ncbi:MAG TPA: ABC transporter ATP-binding protein [Gaiellaceae bacterium]|nr:ABC transporter ATP-binding protein [Gaiellaceae bacterium]